MNEPPNPPAFPRDGKIVTPDGKSYTELKYAQQGMSLRDHYAGLAMASILSNPNVNPLECGDKQVSELAFFFANGMLLKRSELL